MPRRADLGKIPAVDLAYALNRLIQEGKTSVAEVRRYADERPVRIVALERELATLKTGHVGTKRVGRPPGPRAAGAKPKRKFTMTAKARAARRRQGHYLAALRALKPAERARVKALARKEGVAKAVEVARKLAKAAPAKAA